MTAKKAAKGDPEVEEALTCLARALRSALPEGSFAERERAALELSNEAVRRVLEGDLQQIADSFDDRVEIRGQEYRRHEAGTVQYYSLCGPLCVVRDTYRQVGKHNGPTVVPLELAAGIVKRATPELGRNIAHGYAEHDMRSHAELLAVAHRYAPPRATLERIAVAIAGEAQEAVAGIERTLRRSERLPVGAQAIVIGLDRGSVPMAEPRSAGAAPTKGRRKKPYERKPPEPVEVCWRMAYVGTVSIVDNNGENLLTRRYAASPAQDATVLVDRMMADVRAVLKQQPKLRVAVIQDGAPEMWNRVREGLEVLKKDRLLRAWHEGVDFYHLLERLAAALELLGRDDRELQLRRFRTELVSSSGAIDEVEAFLRFYRHELTGETLKKYEVHLTYLRNNKDRMDYAALRRAGLPIGSGVTESAAKNVIGLRAKRSGQRWSEPGLHGALTLRALLKSDRMRSFWTTFSRRYAANVNNVASVA